MIKTSSLEFAYPGNERKLFRNLSFNVEPGEKVALIGPSGAGKTTLIRILAGLRPISGGEIHFANQPMDFNNDSALSHLRNHQIGVVFQNYNLLRDLTVAENLELRLAIAGKIMSRNELKEALEKVDMSDYLDARAGSLSGGQQQRIAVVRALITSPHLVLADEPTGNLDDVSAQFVIDQLTEDLPDRTVIVATHDVRVLEKLPRHLELASLEVGSRNSFCSN